MKSFHVYVRKGLRAPPYKKKSFRSLVIICIMFSFRFHCGECIYHCFFYSCLKRKQGRVRYIDSLYIWSFFLRTILAARTFLLALSGQCGTARPHRCWIASPTALKSPWRSSVVANKSLYAATETDTRSIFVSDYGCSH